MNLIERANVILTRSLPIKTVRSNASTAVASITFDDFPKSAWTVAGAILARHGAMATYYTAGRFCGQTEDGIEYYDQADLVALRDAGHEIGCHSFAHDQAPRLNNCELNADLDLNAAFMTGVLGAQDLPSYAYPYGASSPRTKARMARRFATARGIRSGVNSGTIDLAQLKSIPLEARRWRPDEIDAAIDQAVATRGWVIFFTHDVSQSPSPFGCTPAMLEHALERLARARIEVLPVKHAMARVVFGSHA